MQNLGGKFLTFLLKDELYGIPIQRIREIIGIIDITEIPKAPEYVKGVINLRGKIIPIIDMRLKFGFEQYSYNQRTCIVIVEVKIGEETKHMGIVVDTVSEVINVQNEQIELPPQFGGDSNSEFLTGIGKLKDKVILLLDIDNVIDIDGLVVINKTGRDM